MCVSGIWTSITWKWWFEISFEPNSGNNQATQKLFTHVKGGQM